MTDVLLLHHAQGRTAGVVALAERLRAAGHTVLAPDLYDGRTFPTLEDGMAEARRRGFGAIQQQGVAAADELPGPFAVIGLSLGVMAAQQLAQTHPDVRAAAFVASCLPPGEFGAWPASVPVQVHGAERDPIFATEGDLAAARELVEAAADGQLYLYPVEGHLFVDESLPDGDPIAAEAVVERVLALLARAG